MSAVRKAWLSRFVGRYGFALAVVALAVLAGWLLPQVLGNTPYLAFYPAVVAAAALGGFGPGMVATTGSLLCIHLFYDNSAGRSFLNNPVALDRLAVFLASGLATSVIAQMQLASRQNQRRQAQEHARTAAGIAQHNELLADLELAGIVDAHAIQSLMDNFYQLVRIPMAIVDLKGKVLVGVGWQDICTQYHRAHPETCRHCIESDTLLTAGVTPGQFRLYKCRNNMWDVATPIRVGDKHVGNLFSGQFFFDDETPDRELFRSQAKQYGFDEGQYLAALDAVPRLSRASVNAGMSFFVELASLISRLSYSNIKLARSSEALRRSEEQLRVAALAGEIGVWSWVPGASDVSVSANWRRLFGVVPEAPVTLETWRNALHPADRDHVISQLNAAAEQHREFNVEYRVVCPDGAVRWIVDRGRASYDENGRALSMAGVNVDITRRKQTEQDLVAAKLSAEQAKAAAERASFAKDHFLAVLSHELRTPLTPVLAAVSMIQQRPDSDTELREMLEMIRRNVELEARLIDDLLDLTRIVRGKVDLQKQRVDLCTIIPLAVEVCRSDIEARALRFGVDVGPAAPYWVEVDPARLQQVLWNLLKNAIKFTPNQGCVGVRCRLDGDGHVCVEVHDNGIGIQPPDLPRIFDAFEQAEQSITRQFGGLGLGLAISKALVEMHSGTIEAHSEGKGKGATFRIRLPLASTGRGPLVAHSPEPSRLPTANRQPPTPLRILLVEDHGDTARTMSRLLEMDGYQVKTAGDIATAIQLADQHAFDLLLSDIGLPDGSGHELMRQLRKRGHTFPGIALSGYGQEQDIQRSHKAGFAAHLTKPTSPDRLIEVIASIIS